MKSNAENTLIDENKYLKKENEELKTRLSINKKIIQDFFKNSNINDKLSLFVENIKQENKLLLSKVENLQKENEKFLNKNPKLASAHKDIDTYENKLFVYENLLKEKQSIIITLKEQNNNLKEILNSKISKKEIKIQDKNINNNENIMSDTNENKTTDENNNNNNLNKDELNSYFIEEIYITSPHKVINSLNGKIELYKSINIKLKDLIKELKTTLNDKEKEYSKLEEDAIKMKQELQKFTQMKNNEEIINQLIQYQSMKSIPISQSCSDFKVQNNDFNQKNTRNKTKTRSSSYIMTYNNMNLKKNKIMKEIEVYENVNKTVKEITDNDFDLAGEWAETLKHCDMTQEEFLRFCGMKITNKLTNAIEYLYKILIDKNIQIKLLSQENETLNEENIRLNKINIEMESIIGDYQKNKNNMNINKIISIKDNKEKLKKDKIKKRNNSFFDDYKNKFLNETNKNKFSTSSTQNELQSTFVNVDNNITHTNININMMMDYDRIPDINKNSVTSSEFRDGLLLNDLNKINKVNNKQSLSINNKKNNNSKSNQNISDLNIIEPNKINKSRDKVIRYLKLSKKKINNNSYNKLIIDKKNDNMNEKTQNISAIKKSYKNFNIKDYNRTIKNIFNNTEKIQLKNIKKKISHNYQTNINQNKPEINNNINFNAESIINNLKLINHKNKYKKIENNKRFKISKSESKIFKVLRKYSNNK